jgi:hypothetical protein
MTTFLAQCEVKRGTVPGVGICPDAVVMALDDPPSWNLHTSTIQQNADSAILQNYLEFAD